MAAAPSTRDRLRETALALFAERGFAAVTVAEIAAAAGVSHMTFFRHFPTKESVVVSDPFDPRIAELVAARPADEAPLARAVGGLLDALAIPEAAAELGSDDFRRRLELIARTPELAAASWSSGEASRTVILEALRGDAPAGEDAACEAAAGAVIGAATALLLSWAASPSEDPATLLRRGLRSLPGAERTPR